MTKHHAIVVGAGIVGKASALQLARLGLKVLHLAPSFEKAEISDSSPDSWDSRIYALSASSQQLLKKLRVWDALNVDRIQVVSDMRVYGDDVRFGSSNELHFSAYGATVRQLAWITESNQIESTLDQATQFQGTVERCTDRLASFFVRDDGVELTTVSGHIYRAQLMIAADGAHSGIRQELGIQTLTDDYDQTAVVANFTTEKPHGQTAYQWFLEGQEILALLPLPGQRMSMVWSARHDHAPELVSLAAESPERFCIEVGGLAHGQVGLKTGQLHLLTSPQTFPLRRIRATSVIAPEKKPRVILVGDAAHVMHPLAGQGLNLGLRDVLELGKVLEAKEEFRAIDDPVVLRRYERARHGDTDALLTTTDTLQRLFASDSKTLHWARNKGLAWVNKSAFLKRQLIKKALS